VIARRRFLGLALGLPAALAGCGWEPLYADHETEPASADLRAIQVSPINERIGQRLEMGLRNSLNPANEPTPKLYLLKVTLVVSFADTGITSEGLGTRGTVQGSASYNLTDIKTNKVLQTSSLHAYESFDIQANGYSTVVAQDDASTRIAEELRREIVTRLTLYMQKKDMPAS
jgi:LPS-assembly lipoprotein